MESADVKGATAKVRSTLVTAGSRLIDRSPVLATTLRTFWRWHRTFWMWRLADGREHRQVQVGDTSARFNVSTWSELVRSKHLGGERHVLAALLDDLDGDEVVWDIGACVGTYTCLIARRLTTGSIVAFEPEPTNRRRLKENLMDNELDLCGQVLSFALSDRSGKASLESEFTEVGAGHHSLTEAETDVQIETRRGDDLVRDGLPAPTLLKIDVQGAELRVLSGLSEALEGVGIIYLEVHPTKCRSYGYTAEDVENHLAEAGFTLEKLRGPTNYRADIYFIRASR